MVRVKGQPNESLTLNLLYYDFTLDEPAGLDPALTSDNWGDEINFAADWAATGNIYLIGVLGLLIPGRGAEQFVGGDQDWFYSMGYVSFAW
jgi:hypothetical protein